jgi:putative nucleotidyltransferase with HDIG domain
MTIEVLLIKADGSLFLASTTIGHMIWNGRPTAQIIIQDITEQRKAEETIERSYNDIALAYDATLAGMVRILDLRHKEADGHTYRVTEMAVRLARALGIRGDDLVHIRRGALLHDIGKMAIPDTILFKTNMLTEDEWALIRKHPEFAYEWLSPITFLRSSLDIPYAHHEKWDGTGYPRGLKGENIPLAARIFAVVDVWDSLRTPRPYRPAWTDEKVRSHIRLLAGTHFQPDIVDVFLTLPTPDSDIEPV